MAKHIDKILKLQTFLMLLFAISVFGQQCPRLIYPPDGAIGVPVDATISWPNVNGISAFIFSLGSTPDGEDILNRRTSGPINSYTPPLGLPDNTQIYMSIILQFEDGSTQICPGQTFSTEDVTTPPPCTTLSEPINGETNVSSNTPIQWNYAYGATGYRLSIGTAPGTQDILSGFDVGNTLSYKPPLSLPIDTEIFVSIVPYNENGNLGPCREESFLVDESANFCEPFFDSSQGGLVKRRPEINFPDRVAICQGNLATRVPTEDLADGFRWFRIHPDGTETFLSDGPEVGLSEIGQYRYEAYNNIVISGSTIECSATKEFSVYLSEAAVINGIDVMGASNNREIRINASGSGDYEFALNDPNGPYQNNNVFINVSERRQIVYVRDKNGCGITEGIVARELSVDDFPKFFTPNGDGINDFWQYIVPRDNGEIKVDRIWIFDRYGFLIVQIDPASQGWDGNYRGKALPSSDYWFKAVSPSNQNIRGHFTLKR
ncbi:T9SS type B sorting domain-containing protein [Ulvibacterium marinum]|uniref:T9SS type B sorting domain-containing protein n=1 Tax=Ulvibacterium marinum TaxID=2419782 RepID=UPI002494C043|nr:T9SS type B sorting domain-containing protein [Ulvibacterium marinum]